MEAKHSISMAMLSEELERRTQETLKLQEDVEHVTKLTLERMDHAFSYTDMPENQISTNHESEESPPTCAIDSQHSNIHPINCNVESNSASCRSFQSRAILDHALEDDSQQVLDLQKQLREMHELHEVQKINLGQSSIKLENKLQESQTKKDILANLRLKESGKNAKLMEQLQATQLELHLLKQAEGNQLLEAEAKVKTLSIKAEMMAQMLQDIFTRLSDYEKRSGKSSCFCYGRVFSPSQLSLGPAVEKTLLDLENENRVLREKMQMVEKHLEDLHEQGQEKTECLLQEHMESINYGARIGQFITSHEQKVAMLTEMLINSETKADSLQHQVEILQQKHESQTPLHQSERSDMEKQKSYTATVRVLEEALAHAHSVTEQVQKERDLSLQQAEEQDAQLCRLTTELRQTAEELLLERQQRQKLEQFSLKVQPLEILVQSLRDQCQKHLDRQLSDTVQQEGQKEIELLQEIQKLKQATKNTGCLHEQSSGEVRWLESSLDKLDTELPLEQHEVQAGRAQLEEAQAQVQTLQAEMELLKLRLEDRKNSSGFLMRPLVVLQKERRNLMKQLEKLRLDNQQLRAALLEAEGRLSAVQQDKTQQHIALSEKTSNLHQLTLEKQQMNAELESQRKKIDQLREEQNALQQEGSKKIKELQLHNSTLKTQHNNIRGDLEQARNTIKALEVADKHGLKVALGIQKEITAKREQIDLLQSRVQMLDEKSEKLTQEKNYEVMRNKRQAQVLLFERKKRKRLETELEAYRTKENLLKSEIERFDTALHKMSDSVAECQEYIQKQQQEIMRLKLQHTLELKEGQNLRSTNARTCEQWQVFHATTSIYRSPINSSPVPVQAHSASQLNMSSRKCSPALELQSLFKEIRSVIDMERSPDTSYTRKDDVTENIEDERRKTLADISYSDQDPVRVNRQDKDGAFSANNDSGLRGDRPCYTSFCVAALGQRSPVHSLLTSDPPSVIHNSPRTQSPTYTTPTCKSM